MSLVNPYIQTLPLGAPRPSHSEGAAARGASDGAPYPPLGDMNQGTEEFEARARPGGFSPETPGKCGYCSEVGPTSLGAVHGSAMCS